MKKRTKRKKKKTTILKSHRLAVIKRAGKALLIIHWLISFLISRNGESIRI